VALVVRQVPAPDAPDELLPLAHLFAYVSDTAMDTLKVVDTSLRTFQEAPAPYFPLLIPVGRRPSRMAVSSDQNRLYVINMADHDVSVVDTGLNIEYGAETWDGSNFVATDPVTGTPLRIEVGSPITDIIFANSASAGAPRLYLAVDDGDFTGRLLVVDVQKILPGGSPNPNLNKIIKTIELPAVPGVVDVSNDGDTVYVSARTGVAVQVVSVPSGTMAPIPVGFPTDLVRYIPPDAGAGRILYVFSKTAQGAWILDLDTMAPRTFYMSPTAVLGNMIPLGIGAPQDMALSPLTPLGGLLSTESADGCPGTAGLITLDMGGVIAADLSGCSILKDADGNEYTAKNAGLFGLTLEMPIPDGTSTVTIPTLTVSGQRLTQAEMALPQYPHIENWANASLNFGLNISGLMRQFTNGDVIYIIYEGRVTTGQSGTITSPVAFTDPQKDFGAAGVYPGADWLVLLNPDGSETTTCDDGTTPLPASEFQITALAGGVLTVLGPLPDSSCIAGPTAYTIRPHGMWLVSIAGFAILGRAVSGSTFVYPADSAIPHFTFNVRDGTQATPRDSTFASAIAFYADPVNTSLGLLLPSGIAVHQDPIYTPQIWAFVSYGGSGALYQFSPLSLDISIEALYQ
jgi:hypothetical protein